MDDQPITDTVFSVGTEYLILINPQRFVEVEQPEGSGLASGAIVLRIIAREGDLAQVSIQELGIHSGGVIVGETQTDVLSIRTQQGQGKIILEGEMPQIEIYFEATLAYNILGEEQEFIPLDEHTFFSPKDRLQGQMRVQIEVINRNPGQGGSSEPTFVVVEGSLRFRYESGRLQAINTLELPLEKSLGYKRLNINDLPNQQDATTYKIGNPCYPVLLANPRKLPIRVVGLKVPNSNPPRNTATPLIVKQQIDKANAIWEKCCISFQKLPAPDPLILDLPQLWNSNDYQAIVTSCLPLLPSDAIHIIFVENALNNVGGGAAYNPGEANAKIVMTNNGSNPQLLAHELGHVLALCHPSGCGGQDIVSGFALVAGEQYTVLEPGQPNPDKNTLYNGANASNVRLAWGPNQDCCKTPDVPNHFIRDFPEHMGAERPTPPSGRDFYSTSYLWNRHSTDPGIITSGGEPPHQQPRRYTDQAQPFKNYLFARLEVTQLLALRDVTVSFYLKHAGMGQTTIVKLGTQTIVPNPQYLQPKAAYNSPSAANNEILVPPVEWVVPSNMPTHGCLIAVIQSAGEPNLSFTQIQNLTWQQADQYVRTDNAWAQRNVNIETVPYGSPGATPFYFAPIIVALPEDQETAGPLEIVYSVDKRLVGTAEVVIVGMEEKPFPMTERTGRILIDRDGLFNPYLTLFVRAVIPAGERLGSRFNVSLEPIVGKTPMMGYTHQWHVGEHDVYITELLEIALGAYEGYSKITDNEIADRLAELHRALYVQRYQSISRLMREIMGARDLIQKFAEVIDKEHNDLMEHTGLGQTIRRLLEVLENTQEEDIDFYSTAALYRQMVSTLQLLVWHIYRTAHQF